MVPRCAATSSERSQSIAVANIARSASDRAEHRVLAEHATLSNTSSPTGEVRKPILSNFWPAANPGSPRSTRNAVTPP